MTPEKLEAALNEALICLDAAFGLLGPYYSEQTLEKLKATFLQNIESKLKATDDSEAQSGV